MGQVSESEQPKTDKLVVGCFVVLGVLVLLSLLLGWFDNTTELIPNHYGVQLGCFALAGLGGLASAIIPLRDSKRRAVGSRGMATALALGLAGFTSVFLMSIRAADIVEGLIDFPPGKTTSRQVLLSISRAYQTHGRGRSWNIQTTPLWSNLDITEDDYDFMLAHRPRGDDSHNPDEISSHGYFCAQVTIEQSGDAVRVMHSGSHKLPKGTVIVCTTSISSR